MFTARSNPRHPLPREPWQPLPRDLRRAALGLGLSLGIACASAKPVAPPAQGPARISGAIVAIEKVASRLELTDRGHRFSVFYDPQTMVRSGSGTLEIHDIRVGDRLVISLDEDARARLMTLAGPQRSPEDSIAQPEEAPAP